MEKVKSEGAKEGRERRKKKAKGGGRANLFEI
jgi:hypothetical protein